MPWKSCFGSIGTSSKSGPKQAQQTEKKPIPTETNEMSLLYTYIPTYVLTLSQDELIPK